MWNVHRATFITLVFRCSSSWFLKRPKKKELSSLRIYSPFILWWDRKVRDTRYVEKLTFLRSNLNGDLRWNVLSSFHNSNNNSDEEDLFITSKSILRLGMFKMLINHHFNGIITNNQFGSRQINKQEKIFENIFTERIFRPEQKRRNLKEFVWTKRYIRIY